MRKLFAETLEHRLVLSAEANIVFAPLEIQEDVYDIGIASALLLDGVDDSVNLAAGESDFDTLTGDFTIEAWIRLDETATGINTILSKGNLWFLQVDADTGLVQFSVDNNLREGSTDIADGEWHHVAAVFDAANSPSVRIYVDGAQDGPAWTLSGSGGLGTNDAAALIGANSQGASRNFAGEIDDVRVWNTFRTQQQIETNRNEPLTGFETGLRAYYNFDNRDATDVAGGNANGVLVGGASFAEPEIVGEVTVQLSAPVTAEPGIILNFEIDAASTATQGIDFYASQLDLSTTDDSIPITNSVFIPMGADSAAISIAALADAIDEADETIIINLLPDTDPFGSGPDNYTVGASSSATINLFDSRSYTAGIAVTNAFGEDATIEGLHLDANDQVIFAVQLLSQPEGNVTVNLNTSPDADLSAASLAFSPDNWDQRQIVVLDDDDFSGNGDGIEDLLTTVSLSSVNYGGAFASVSVYDESDTTRVNVQEGGTTQQVAPTVTIRRGSDAIEGDSQTASFLFASDIVAPEGGLTVAYNLVDDSELGTRFDIFDDGVLPGGERSVVIPEGQLFASVLLNPTDDDIANGDLVITADLAADPAYDLGQLTSASVTLGQDDTAAIELATFTDVDGVAVPTPFDNETLIATTENGDAFDFGVRLTSQPTQVVTVTIESSNPNEGQITESLVFDATNWDVFQNVSVTPQDDVLLDDDRRYNVLISSDSTDAAYVGVMANFQITNQDDESREVSDVEVIDNSPIVATISRVNFGGTEGGADPQFEILLSSPAPVGGVEVAYNIFERSATMEDLALPDYVEQLGDRNPLALTQVERPQDEFVDAESISFGDIDNDGDQDALISFADGNSQLLINEGTDEVPEFVLSESINPLIATGGFGSAFGDVNDDGDLDVIQINSDNMGISYFENQLSEAGSLTFVEVELNESPFASLALVDPGSPVLADLNNDLVPELIITNLFTNTVDYFEISNGGYVAAAFNPLAGFAAGGRNGLTFGDVDRDGDLDAYIGGFDILAFLENVGTPTQPLFVERTGNDNPTNGVDLQNTRQYPALVDINNDGDLDIFAASRRSTGEVSLFFEVRYFEAVEFQTAVVPEGQTSLIVSIPIADDLIDEPDVRIEEFEVGIFSRQTETYDVVAAADFDDEFAVEIVEVLNPTQLGLALVNSSRTNIDFVELLAGTQLDFGGGMATVTDTVSLDDNSISILVNVTIDSGTVNVGDTAAATFDDTVTLRVPTDGDLFDGKMELLIRSEETITAYQLLAGTQLTFDTGVTVEVTQTTLVTSFEAATVPVTLIGQGTVVGGDQVDVSAPLGELNLVVSEPGIDFYALAAGARLALDDGSTFVVTEPAVVSSSAGDYNGDGVVDVADYTVWRDNLGSTQNLAADGDGSGTVDTADYQIWRSSFGARSGAAVTGYIAGGTATTAGARATITETGYRSQVDLLVTDAFDGSQVGIRIDDTAYTSFAIPAGTVLEFDNGAIAVVDAQTSLNDTTGALVPVTLLTDPQASTILVGEGTATADFSTGVNISVASNDGSGEAINLIIDTPGVSTLELPVGTILTFSGGAIVEVFETVTINDTTEQQVGVSPTAESPIQDIRNIQPGEFAASGEVRSVSSILFTIDDNDDAGVNVVNTGTETGEDGTSQTIDLSLTTRPTADVTLVIGLDGGEAVLADSDEAGQSVVSLLFTPINWDVPQTVTVTGIDDQIDDGDVQYTIHTTVISEDVEYNDDAIQVFSPSGVLPLGIFIQVDDIGIPAANLSNNTLISWDNGSVTEMFVLGFGDTTEINNSWPEQFNYLFEEDVDLIGDSESTGGVATVDVAGEYNAGTGIVALRIDNAEQDVISATFSSGYEFSFDNGTVARLDQDTVLSSQGDIAIVPVTLVEGTEIPVASTATFARTLNVAAEYNSPGGNGDIGLQIADPMISAVTLAAGTSLEFTNGAFGTLTSETQFSSASGTTTNISVATEDFSPRATGYYTERLVPDVIFTNTDNDSVGVTVGQTDPTVAVVEGASNNFFTVVLDSEPLDVVAITLTPSDDNIRLADEFMGEPLTIFFDALTWNAPQTIEVSAVDDALLEYDHMSTIDISLSSGDAQYNSLTPPNDVEVFITDDEVPSASIVPVAGAIEANAPGYFIIELDTPAPVGPDNTGIVVTYEVSGTADAEGGVDQTPDIQPLSGSVRIPPGETQSGLIAFPIDDFVTEGLDLVTVGAYSGGGTIALQIDTAPFSVTAYDSMAGTVDLQLQSRADGLETTILNQGTRLIFDSSTAFVADTTIVRDDLAVSVPITLDTGDGTDIADTMDVFQQVLVPLNTELEFADDIVLTVGSDTLVSNESGGTAVPISDGSGVSLPDLSATSVPGESVVVSVVADVAGAYSVGAGSSAAIIILDNDKPGIRVAEMGDMTTVIEAEESGEFAISLLSQPQADVTVTITAPTSTVELIVDDDYLSSDTSIGLSIVGQDVVSLSLPAGVYDFDGVDVTVLSDTVISANSPTPTQVGVNLSGDLSVGATGDYTFNDLLFENGTTSTDLLFTASNWFALQSVRLQAIDDLVVEAGDAHSVDLSYGLTTIDPNYLNLEVPAQPIEIIDRRFDVESTTQSFIEGFLSFEESLESISLPIVGEFSELAPSIIDTFLETLVEEIRATDNLTAETLGDAFENAINPLFADLPVDLLVTEISTDEIAFLLAFGDERLYQVPLNTDLGLEALGIGIQSEGTIDFNVNYGFSIGFGISKGDGFFLNTEETSLEVAASLALSDDFAATGSLGFLQLDVANAVNFADATVETDFEFDAEIDNVIRLEVLGSEFDPISLAADDVIVIDSSGESVEITVGEEIEIDGAGVFEIAVSAATAPVFVGDATVLGDPDGTMIDAGFVVTLEDANDTSGDETRLTLSEISAARGSNDPYSFISYGFSGDAVLDLDIATTVSGATTFPSFSFNLASSLPLFNYANEDEAGADETPTLEVTTGFANVAEGNITSLTLAASGVTTAVRLTRGTELTFDGVSVIVHQTTTLDANGTPESVQVRVSDDMDGMSETQSILVGQSTTLESSGFNLAFNDITLDLGSFVTDLMGPVISGINDVIDPFRPVIDVLSSEVQLLSTLGLAGLFDQDDDGTATLVEVALTLGGGLSNQNAAERFSTFVDAVVGVIELTDSLTALEESIGDNNLAINFGSYTLENFRGGSENSDAAMVDVETEGTADEADTAPIDQTMSTGNGQVSNFFSALDDLGITLDVIENPLNVIKLFLGQDIDLVTWDAPELDLGFTIERGFPVFLGIRGLLRGEFNVYSDLVFGFDTFGFSQWAADDFALSSSYLVFDGFYVSDIDPESGEDVPELTLDATIAAGVEANAVIASVAAVGGITGSATLDLIDVGEYSDESDGRIRGSEFFSRISRPASLFELTGAIEAFLEITVSIGINLGFWKIEKVVFERELARATLFEFVIGGGESGSAGSLATAGGDVSQMASLALAPPLDANPTPEPIVSTPASTITRAASATSANVDWPTGARVGNGNSQDNGEEILDRLFATYLGARRWASSGSNRPEFGLDSAARPVSSPAFEGWDEVPSAEQESIEATDVLAPFDRDRQRQSGPRTAEYDLALEEFAKPGPRRWARWFE